LSNAFFSGSVKGFHTLPFLFPATEAYYLGNGTHIDPQNATYENWNFDFYYVWKGFVT